MNKILSAIKSNKRFIISTHVNPDPDAICSELALAEYLRQLKKDVVIVNEEKLASRFKIFDGIGKIKFLPQIKGEKFDVAIIVDCGDLERIGKVQSLIKPPMKVINIDHHITNKNFGDLNLVKIKSSSTAEVLFELFKKGKCRLTKSLARNLYAGIMTDTGSFRYDNTTAQTHAITAELMRFPFSASALYRQVYETIPLNDLQLFTKVVSGFESLFNQQLIVVELTRNLVKKFSEDFDLRDMIFRFLRSIHGVKAFVILTEVGKNETRVNFRSSGEVNVAEVARHFNGGGHKNASGGVLKVKLKDAKKVVVNYMAKHL